MNQEFRNEQCVCLSTELGVASAIETEVGRRRCDGSRLSTPAPVKATPPRAGQHGDGPTPRSDLHRPCCER